MDEILLQNVFYSFWYCLGDYFLVAMGWTSFVAIILAITHTLTKR
jgi:hypothetical protein